MEDFKRCKKCFSEKSLSDFWIQASSKDGRQTYCKECHNDKSFGNKRNIISVDYIEGEIWKDVIRHEDRYQVSNLGRVKIKYKLYTRSQGRISERLEELMTTYTIGGGDYIGVRLSLNGKKHNVSIHRLVCEAFHPNPDNKPQVNHINGVKWDNRSENLEWCTILENVHHSILTGLRKGNYKLLRS